MSQILHPAVVIGTAVGSLTRRARHHTLVQERHCEIDCRFRWRADVISIPTAKYKEVYATGASLVQLFLTDVYITVTQLTLNITTSVTRGERHNLSWKAPSHSPIDFRVLA